MELLHHLMLQDLLNSDAFFGVENQYFLKQVNIRRREILKVAIRAAGIRYFHFFDKRPRHL